MVRSFSLVCATLAACAVAVGDATLGPTKSVRGRTRVIDPNAKNKGRNATAAAEQRANLTRLANAEKDEGAKAVTVDLKATGCVDFPGGGRARAPHVSGTFTAPRPVGMVEFGKYARQLAQAKPTLTLTSAWEAQIGPGRLLGESNGYHCVGCEHPLSRTWMLGSVKKRSLANFNAGKPFRRIVGCLREINDKCTMFCYEWGIKESTAAGNATAYRSKLVTADAKVPELARVGPFPPLPREPNTVIEYHAVPDPKANNPPPIPSRAYLEPGQYRDSLNNLMVNECECSCTTTNTTMGAQRPFSCDCHCPPQHGDRGKQGPAGYEGPRGPRGGIGNRGPKGPIGLRGHLGKGEHRFATCGCYHENVMASSGGNALLGCSKEGHAVVGLRPRARGCNLDEGGVNCLGRIKCCRPCFKIKGAAPPTSTLTFGTRFTKEHSETSDGPEQFRAIYRRGEQLAGYCSGKLDKLSGFTNRNHCKSETFAGVDHEIAYHFKATFTPHVTRKWRVRVGGDYGRGAILLVDGETWANRAGENLNWGGRFDSSSVIEGLARPMQAFKTHTIELYGLEGVGDGEQTMQIDFGEGWMDATPGAFDLGCK